MVGCKEDGLERRGKKGEGEEEGEWCTEGKAMIHRINVATERLTIARPEAFLRRRPENRKKFSPLDPIQGKKRG